MRSRAELAAGAARSAARSARAQSDAPTAAQSPARAESPARPRRCARPPTARVERTVSMLRRSRARARHGRSRGDVRDPAEPDPPAGSVAVRSPRWLARIGARARLGARRGRSPRCSSSTCAALGACAATRIADAVRAPPSHVRDLDIRPESLPADIGAAARAAVAARRAARGARAAVSRPAVAAGACARGRRSRDVEHGRRMPRASRAPRCRRRAATTSRGLVDTWQRAVYGGRRSTTERVPAPVRRVRRRCSIAAPRRASRR